MKKLIQTTAVIASLLLGSVSFKAFALDIVYDPQAVTQMIEEVKISQEQLDALTESVKTGEVTLEQIVETGKVLKNQYDSIMGARATDFFDTDVLKDKNRFINSVFEELNRKQQKEIQKQANKSELITTTLEKDLGQFFQNTKHSRETRKRIQTAYKQETIHNRLLEIEQEKLALEKELDTQIELINMVGNTEDLKEATALTNGMLAVSNRLLLDIKNILLKTASERLLLAYTGNLVQQSYHCKPLFANSAGKCKRGKIIPDDKVSIDGKWIEGTPFIVFDQWTKKKKDMQAFKRRMWHDPSYRCASPDEVMAMGGNDFVPMWHRQEDCSYTIRYGSNERLQFIM